MSTNISKNLSGRGSKKDSSQPSSAKALRRDYSQVDPTSPESPISCHSLRIMLQESLEPVTQELTVIKKGIKANADKLDSIESLTKRCKALETENVSLKKSLALLRTNVR